MIVYAKSITKRAEYIFSTLLSALGIDHFEFTADEIFFRNFTDFKINYSGEKIAAQEFWIKPVGLLFEAGIEKQSIDFFSFDETKAFFKTSEANFPFDIFAASFYLLSRYEEYLPHKPDKYGRFDHENSLAYQQQFLNLPLINIWIQEFALKLFESFPALQVKAAPFRFLPTYDIDIAWSYQHKGVKRNAGGFLQSIFHGEWPRVSERLNVLFGNQKDPFDSYQWLDELHENYQLKPIYFFLSARKNKEYDKNISPAKKAWRKLVSQHNAKYATGIHPSWQSGDKQTLLAKEIETLRRNTNKKVSKSRQHYIRFSLPETYRRLIDAGISEDYSMGYGATNGFRASYCLPFKWYDLAKEEITSLTIYPFCFMDATSCHEQTKTPQEALDEMMHYFIQTKNVNGLLITISHNQFFGTDTMFTGWKETYETFIKKLSGT